MKGYNVYSRIQQLKEKGFKKATVAKQLHINRRTVDKYWSMSVEDYEKQFKNVCRASALDEHQDQIIHWLRDYPTLSAAQVCDWLKEYYNEYYSERTVSRYVKVLRDEYNLKKSPNPRDYEAVPELPMGQQMQVDFGKKNLHNITGGTTAVYVAAFVLAHSRYKYTEIQSRPFTASDLVAICYRCFRYMGGMPQELVFDQDSIVCVSENDGDIIYTYEFEKFRKSCKLDVYLCRGADPESKGKVENVVKYVKGNFLENRLYVDDDTLNASAISWLERTGNAKEHGTTKRIPAEVFREERDYLRPLPECPQLQGAYVLRNVRKDNTILYNSNRYSVPLGTYNNQKEVQIEERKGVLYISTVFGDPICEHRIGSGRGKLIQNTSHRRDRSRAIDKFQNQLDERMEHKATEFLQLLREEKNRYSRDQFTILQMLLDTYDRSAVLEAIEFCMRNRIYSANTVKDYLEHQSRQKKSDTDTQQQAIRIPLDDARYHIQTQKRPLDVYARIGGGRQ